MSVSLPAACPYLPLPAVSQGRVRDLSLTDFPGQPLLVFFYPADWCDTEDLLELAAARPRFRRAGCQLFGGACLHSAGAVSSWAPNCPTRPLLRQLPRLLFLLALPYPWL